MSSESVGEVRAPKGLGDALVIREQLLRKMLQERRPIVPLRKTGDEHISMQIVSTVAARLVVADTAKPLVDEPIGEILWDAA